MALSDVIVSQRGGLNPVRLSAGAVQVSWEVMAPGAFSCDLVTRELLGYGLPLGLEGYWVAWEHPTAGPWAGVITASGDTSEGIFRISAAGNMTLLARRTTMLKTSASPGALFRKALAEISTGSTPTFVTIGQVDESGADIALDGSRVQVLEDLITRLCDEGDREWEVTPARVANFVKQLGRDRRNSVRLALGTHIATYSITGDTTLIENILHGTGKLGREAVNQTERDQASVDRYGALEGERDYGKVTGGPQVRQMLQDELAKTALPKRTINAQLVEQAGEWADFREGDTVRIALGSAAAEYDLRVMARSYTDAGTLDIAGEATDAS